MRRIKSWALLALSLLCPMSVLAQKDQFKVYEVLSATPYVHDSTTTVVTDVMTIGDSIIVLEGTKTPMADREIMFAPTLMYLNTYLTHKAKDGDDGAKEVSLFKDSCEIRQVRAVDPKTKNISDNELLGIGYWKDVKAGQALTFMAFFTGKIKVGTNRLLLGKKSEDDGELEGIDIRIANTMDDATKQRRVAYPTTTVNVREAPTAQSAIVGQANANQALVAEYSPLSTSDYYMVVLLNSGKTGYVHKKYLRLGTALPKVSHGALTLLSRSGGVDVKPVVQITNHTNVTIHVNLAGTDYTLLPGKTRKVTVNAGMCYQLVTGKGHNPYYGVETLQEGCVYDWTFVSKPVKTK